MSQVGDYFNAIRGSFPVLTLAIKLRTFLKPDCRTLEDGKIGFL
jgi:hypothetical protein